MLQKKIYQPPTVLEQPSMLLEDLMVGSNLPYFEMVMEVGANPQYFEDDYEVVEDWQWQGGWDPMH